MVGHAQRVRPLAAMLASIAIVGAARAEAPTEPSKDAGVPVERQPYYYDRLLVDRDFKNVSVGFMRVLHNNIYARAGRPFKDPIWREYFESQPWYHARPEGAAKLSSVDEANLRTIKRWEAKLVEEREQRFDSTFKSLVRRGPSADREWPVRADCEADARGVLADRKTEEKLVALSARVRWSDLKNRAWGYGYDYVTLSYLDQRGRGVRLACLPDLDGDGTPESIVAIIYPHGGDPEDTGGHDTTFELTFLVSGKSPAWRVVAPLAITGDQTGVEGGNGASVELVRIEEGKWGLAVRTVFDPGNGDTDENCRGEGLRRYSLKNGKLTQIGAASHRRICDWPLSREARECGYLKRQ